MIYNSNKMKLKSNQKIFNDKKSNHKPYVYIIKDKKNDEIIYVGKDESISKGRMKQHYRNREIILQYHSLIDIKLALLDKQDIEVELVKANGQNVNEVEKSLIQLYEPKYNQTHNTKN